MNKSYVIIVVGAMLFLSMLFNVVQANQLKTMEEDLCYSIKTTNVFYEAYKSKIEYPEDEKIKLALENFERVSSSFTNKYWTGCA